jgi:hypothetical protein
MKEWFYVKNDLKVQEDIKDIIMRPIWQRFGLWKPKVEIDEAAEECRKAFGIVCSFIGTRDLVQEHCLGRTPKQKIMCYLRPSEAGKRRD